MAHLLESIEGVAYNLVFSQELRRVFKMVFVTEAKTHENFVEVKPNYDRNSMSWWEVLHNGNVVYKADTEIEAYGWAFRFIRDGYKQTVSNDGNSTTSA